MAVWASLVSRAHTSRMAAGGLCREMARSTFCESTSTLPMADLRRRRPSRSSPGGRGVPDWSWPAHPPRTQAARPRPRQHGGAARRRAAGRPGRVHGPGIRPGSRSSPDATPGRAGAGIGRTAPPRRARRWPRRPTAGRRGNGGTPGSTRATTGPGPTLPPAAPQGVETPVVADPEAGVGLDVVPGQRSERGPGVERPGCRPHHVGHGVAAPLPRLGQRRARAVAHGLGLVGQDRLGQPGGQPDRGHVGRGHRGCSWRVSVGPGPSPLPRPAPTRPTGRTGRSGEADQVVVLLAPAEHQVAAGHQVVRRSGAGRRRPPGGC